MQQRTERAAGIQVLFGIVALVVGSTVYLFDRPVVGLPYLPEYLPDFTKSPVFSSAFGYVLPAFAHTAGFSLLTTGLLATGRAGTFAAVLFWILVDSAFEIGQHSALAVAMKSYLAEPAESGSIPIGSLYRHFLCGSFDPWDLVAILSGGAAAYGCVILVKRKYRCS